MTPEGVVKVLDFGLAKSSDPAASTANSPTITMRATQAGMIMGTTAYMAPVVTLNWGSGRRQAAARGLVPSADGVFRERRGL